ncbi:histidine phosphatase superfamily [Xylariaceae sp. FL0255]|nr:histidine phosphatase superfamily [Xylariaceae sp. FL0255]
MAPTIHLVRHAQGYHNVKLENQWLPDPDLTELGRGQCEKLCATFPFHDQVTHLIASPIRRTLYTCKLSFGPAVVKLAKILALPDAQEVSLYPCDIGTEPSALNEEFGDLVDLHLVQPGWNKKTPESRWYPDAQKLDARARDARISLREIAKEAGDDAHIVLVSHGGILHFITGDWQGIEAGAGTGWENTEYRSYHFADKTWADPNATLKELPESRARRDLSAPLDETEHRQLRAAFEVHLQKEVKICLDKIANQQSRI